jgi:hypothetical protein
LLTAFGDHVSGPASVLIRVRRSRVRGMGCCGGHGEAGPPGHVRRGRTPRAVTTLVPAGHELGACAHSGPRAGCGCAGTLRATVALCTLPGRRRCAPPGAPVHRFARIALSVVDEIAMVGTAPLVRDFLPRMGRAQGFGLLDLGSGRRQLPRPGRHRGDAAAVRRVLPVPVGHHGHGLAGDLRRDHLHIADLAPELRDRIQQTERHGGAAVARRGQATCWCAATSGRMPLFIPSALFFAGP